jgi:hypothetical protein
MSSAELARTVETSQNKAPAAERGNGVSGVSGVSKVFPRFGNSFSAYLKGYRLSVSVFPVFLALSGGVSL